VLVVLVMSRLRRHSQKKVVLPVKGGGGGLLLSPFGSVGIVDFQRETTTRIFFVWQRKAKRPKISLSKKEAKKGDHKRERKKVLANFFLYSLFRGLLV
jgi:hypothetical protein